jgi:O-antigen/teichoic acid export membrane protein
MSFETIVVQDDGRFLGRRLFWMTWSGTVSISNSILLWVFFARMRDVDELGRFTIVMGLYALFYSLCTLGLFSFIIAEISRRSAPAEVIDKGACEFVASSAVYLGMAGTASAVLMSLSGLWTSASAEVRHATFVLSFSLIASSLIGVAEAAAVASGRTKLVALVSTAENLARTVIPFLLILYGFGITAICVSFAAVRIIALGIYVFDIRQLVAWLRPRAHDLRLLVARTPTFAVTTVLSSIIWQFGIVLLGHYAGDAESANFGVASRFLIPVTILMASYGSVIQPVLARAALEGYGSIRVTLTRMLRLPLAVFAAAALLSPFVSETVLSVLFGEQYASSAPTLDILAVSAVPFCLVMVLSRALIAMNAQRIDMLANAVGVCVFLAAAPWFIPRYGAWGAAITQLLAFATMSLVELVYVSTRFMRARIAAAEPVSAT